MTVATECTCEVRGDLRLDPCPRHEELTYRTWLAERAPRLAAAEEAGDPYVERLRDDCPAAEDIPEFAPFREELSPRARQLFDNAWQLGLFEPGPGQWELALMVRDDWKPLVQAYERQVLRMELADAFGAEVYPFSYDERRPYDRRVEDARTPQQLLAEADRLGEFIRQARQLEGMLRDHATGGSIKADEI
ncbi:hypothetical protein [Nonomuraea jiangxiensis]|uniref:Uncharacterized protein n=1 Tax=Nonomuraea jiangxiensis TaxID=633440 RepID=A0A1G9VXX5_9ACTN|nr:hypothetical protein [Nonomuraea jiangxiensis]SDM76993.1 hypothetical protein SAMN05421869_15513 [Nonomuraea jiangxiensis]